MSRSMNASTLLEVCVQDGNLRILKIVLGTRYHHSVGVFGYLRNSVKREGFALILQSS